MELEMLTVIIVGILFIELTFISVTMAVFVGRVFKSQGDMSENQKVLMQFVLNFAKNMQVSGNGHKKTEPEQEAAIPAVLLPCEDEKKPVEMSIKDCISKALEAGPKKVKDIAGAYNLNVKSVQAQIGQMVKKGKVEKLEDGTYGLLKSGAAENA